MSARTVTGFFFNVRRRCYISKNVALTNHSTERIVKPNISMVPAGEVFWGQELRITCSAVAEPSTKTFILQKTPGSFRQTLSTSSRTGTFTVSKVNFDYDGLYQCQYKKTVDGETFTSPLSDPLNITVSGENHFLILLI